jgi:hypothetical protein
MGLKAIPMIFINGRFLPRWRREGEPILQRVLEEASPQTTPEAARVSSDTRK